MTIAAVNPAVELGADVITLAGLTSPGKATIRKLTKPRKWDEVVGYGLSGSGLRYLGNRLARFEVLFELWDLFRLEDIDRIPFFKLLDLPPSGLTPLAMDIWHPVLLEAGIRSVVVGDAGRSAWEQDDYGLWSCVCPFIEFRLPVPALAAITASIPTDPGSTEQPTDALGVAQQQTNARIAAAKASNVALGASAGGF